MVSNTSLLLPMILYFLMALSLLWTISFKISIDALTKEIPLLLLPLCFMILPISRHEVAKILSNYGYIFLGYTFFYLLKAVIKYLIFKDTNVFFYHELVTADVNAIHVSVYCVLAFFVFLMKQNKKQIDTIAIPTLLLFIFLLSSKNIIVVFLFLLVAYFFFYPKTTTIKSWKIVLLFGFVIIGLFSFSKVQERISTDVFGNNDHNGNYNIVTVSQAFTQEKFSPNDFFTGTAFRVYQTRLFFDFLQEEPIFWTGFGLNASSVKIKEKANQYNVFQGDETHDGYQNKNFHNQYIQNFAELGVFGCILLLMILWVTLRKSVKRKDFIHFSFAILMISLFLTESFLWRQRGVIFFTLFYALFSSVSVKSKTSQIEKSI